MKTVFLSISVFIYGYFCDILRKVCQKIAEHSLKSKKQLTKRQLVLLSRLAEKHFFKWRRLEKHLIFLLMQG